MNVLSMEVCRFYHCLGNSIIPKVAASYLSSVLYSFVLKHNGVVSLFSFKLFYMVFGMMSHFLTNPGHFDNYVGRFLILHPISTGGHLFLDLACRFWLTFVTFSSNGSLEFRAQFSAILTDLFWLC